MSETIMCPYTQEGASPHKFEHKSQIEDGSIVHYCGKCKNVISVETRSNMINVNHSDGLHLRGNV
jgi:hypothetical protein